ncbi:MAG: DUF11 domain-containing protein [Actinobacteria bacterium]|nr:MAG: DUF11 domain-containing protein [Actinomycetota bacterium]
MRLRLKSVLATLVTTGIVAGMLGFAQVAQAATTPPPFEPDPAARGCLNFYDANGNLKTSGSINDSPIAAFAMGDAPSRAGDIFGTLYAAQPEAGQPSQSWLTDQMSAGNPYPSSDPTTPANLRNKPNALYIAAAGDSSVATELTNLPHPASDAGTAFDGAYQLRFITTGPTTGTDTLYWRAAIKVSGTTWTQTWCPPPTTQAQGTTTTLTAAPPSPQPPGTTVNLTASVAPTTAVGSVQFQSDAANLGPAVSVTAGTATTSTNSLAAGTHSLTAAFTPTDPTAFTGSTSQAVPYAIAAATASTDLGVTKTGPATATTGGSADLSISKHAFPGSGGDEYPRLQVGNSFLYVLAVRNLGPSKATGVTVTDQLPAGVTFRKVATSRGTCTQASGTVSCALGTLKKGGTAWVTIKVTASAAGKITNTATVSGDQPDPRMGNNSSSVTITVAKAGQCLGHDGDCRSGGGQSALLGGLLSALRVD